MCRARGINYTRQHAQSVSDLLKHVQDSFRSLRSQQTGVLQVTPSFIENLFCSPRAIELQARIHAINKESENETEGQHEREMQSNDNELSVTQASQAAQRISKEQENHPSSLECGEKLCSLKCDSEAECTNSDSEEEHCGRQQLSTEEQKVAGDVADRHPEVDETYTQTGVMQLNQLFNHLFGTESESTGSELTRSELTQAGTGSRSTQADQVKEKANYTEKAQTHDRVGGVDFVPAFRASGWPKVAQDWITRQRQWPSSDTVNRIIQDGFHIVVKPPKLGGRPECDFRLSFSHAEFLLSQDMNDVQRECYRCLKKLYHAYLCTKPKALVTYHLKNVLLHTCEEIGTDLWLEENRAKCMMKLLANLHEVLMKKCLPHFFATSCNLFDENYIENPEVLESLATKVEQIMCNPIEFSEELLQTSSGEAGSSSCNPFDENYVDNPEVLESLATKVEQMMCNPIEFSKELLQASSGEAVSPPGKGKPVSTGNPAGRSSKLSDGVAARSEEVEQRDSKELVQDSSFKAESPPEGGKPVLSGNSANSRSKLSDVVVARREEDEQSDCTDAQRVDKSSLKVIQSNNRFHDLRDLFVETCDELISMALNQDYDLLTLNPVESSVVQDIREISKTDDFQAEKFLNILSASWDMVYLKVYQSREPDPRQRVLVGIQGLMELMKYFLQQDDFQTGNLEHIIYRTFDHTDPQSFDLNHLLPAGCGVDFVRGFLGNFERKPLKQQATGVDDIPLD